MNTFSNKNILVTGCCGTVGSELIDQLADKKRYQVNRLIGLDNYETALFFQDQKYLEDQRVSFFQCDVRDKESLSSYMRNIDVVFHCAALKHVILCERSPGQAIETNIKGIQNIITAARANSVRLVVFTSSDKAVNPTNVMGTTKLMGERLMTAANNESGDGGTVFTSTRFGNVLGSSGSVIPVFHNQIQKGGPVTVTEIDMTRFVMSVEEATNLVLDSALVAKGGEIFITKMPVIKIIDLAHALIEELSLIYGHDKDSIEIEIIGKKPGEKNYEELMSEEEKGRAIELKDYFCILPAFRGIYSSINYAYEGVVSYDVKDAYVSSSQDYLDVADIKNILKSYSLLDAPKERQSSRYWPGDKETDTP